MAAIYEPRRLEQQRKEMLESFCNKDSRFEISRIQVQKDASQKGYDFEMLQEIQQCYPKAELYFLTGSDKLFILPRWHRINEFLAQFKILVARCGEDELEQMLRPDWEQVKVGIIEEIVRAKFTQNQELGWRLAATGDKILIEGNTWGDTCWGVDTRTVEGKNHLGKILMKVRKEIQASQKEAEES